MLQLNSFQKSNAINKYAQSSFLSAAPEKVILMLLEGAGKFMHKAVELLKENNIVEYREHITKAQKIFVELRRSLNYEKGGEIATNLGSLYGFIDVQLSKASIKKDEDALLDAIKTSKTIKLGWETMF